MTKLSIIIPIYNVEGYLNKCLDSVICSSKDYEIVAVNDGSTDNSFEILSAYKEKYSHLLKIVTKENGGLGSARNAGLEVAKGEFVLFLDSDDYLSDDAVPEILDVINEYDADIILFNQVFYNESGRQVLLLPGCDINGPFTLTEYPKVFFFTPNAGNKLYKKSLFTESGITFPPRQWFEDVNSIYLLYLHAKKIIYVDKSWNCHLQREGSITHSPNTRRNLEMIDACKEFHNYYLNSNVYNDIKDELEYCIYYNEFLTSIDRVNLIDRKSDVQNLLKSWFYETFPNFESSNRYFREMPMKYKLLHFLIKNKMYLALNLILRINDSKHN